MNEEASKRIVEEKEEKTGKLDLSKFKLKEVPADLNEMHWLEELDLGGNVLGFIPNLEGLNNLKHLVLYGNQLLGISNLKGLTGLQKLDLSNNLIPEIDGLESLIYLQKLDLSVNRIKEIKNLQNLTNLQELNLTANIITDVNGLKALVSQPALKELRLYGNKKNNLHIPEENFGKDYSDNCLPLLKAYFESIKKGAFYIREVPVILVGNSTSGKTSLLHFIKEKKFPPSKEHSTHGVEPNLWQPPQEVLDSFPNTNHLKNVQFYFWDFGGQEYYHATHRLFFSPEAVYVLVWDTATNKQGVETLLIKLEKANGQIEEMEQPVELFPYTYWLDTIRFFAPDTYRAPIVLVQNKLDTEGGVKERPDNNLFVSFGITDSFHLSVQDANNTKTAGKPYRDFEDFLEHLFTIVKSHVINQARQTHWNAAKALLQQHKAENVWSAQEFLAQLQLVDADINELSMQSYAGDFASKGFIFYYPEVEELKNCIFINPAWVTETIYDILDEEVLQNGGEFDKAKVEAKAGKEYATAFIALLKRFELIFENPVNGKLIAPQYLPAQLIDKDKWMELKDRFNEFAVPDFYIRFPDFMPRSIMLRFLAAYGEKAIGRSYWKKGIAFRLEKEDIAVLYDAEGNGFKIFVKGGSQYVQRLVWDMLWRLTGYKQTLQLGLNAQDFVQYSELLKYSKNNEVSTVGGKMVACAPLQHFVELLDNLKPKPMEKQKPVKIFVSYAHEDEATKDLLVKTHLKAIQNNYEVGLVAWTDAGIKPGVNWDNKIKKEIKNADIILFLITSSFLASDYIKNTEIKNALERFKEKKQIIVPIYIESVARKLLPFKEKQYMPGSTPLDEWEPRSKAWAKIQEGVITLIDDITAGNTGDYFQ